MASISKGIHPGVVCDRSGMAPIIGTRYHLRGHDYDLCQAEFDKIPAAEKPLYDAIPPPVQAASGSDSGSDSTDSNGTDVPEVESLKQKLAELHACGISSPPCRFPSSLSKWQWEDGPRDSSNWKDFDAAADRVLDMGLGFGLASVLLCTAGKTFAIDFEELRQTNIETNFVRSIRNAGLASGRAWEWEDGSPGSERWQPFELAASAKLSDAVSARQSGTKLTLSHGGGVKYAFEFDSMRQIRLRDDGTMTGHVRRIRPPCRLALPTWEWEHHKDTWRPFSLCAAVHLAVVGSATGPSAQPVPLSINGQDYECDLGALKQRRNGTNHVRRLRQRAVPASPSTAPSPPVPPSPSAPPISPKGAAPSDSPPVSPSGLPPAPSPTAPGASGHAQWEWEDGANGSGSWKPFNAESAAILACAKATGVATVALTIGGHAYEVDLAQLTQTKQSSGFVRRIRQQAASTASASSASSSASWEWEEGREGSNQWMQYDAQSAAALTAAAGSGTASFPLTIHGHVYDINLSTMRQRKQSTGFERRLRQGGGVGGAPPPLLLGFPGSYKKPPDYWSEVRAKAAGADASSTWSDGLVPVEAGCAVYVEVCDLLRQTCGGSLTVRSLQLVHKSGRLNLYLAKRDEFLHRLGKGHLNERWLWHGTKEELVPTILSNGFLRDYSLNAMYGKGTYFARDASYSLQKQYAKPTDDGEQILLLSRVLLGKPCKGRKSMDKPEQKPGSVELHESMVDELSNPSIFVLSTGSDNQAFAEFVVTVKRS